MARSPNPFLPRMLSVVLASLFVVMTTAFIMIPQVIGGHPGEAGNAGAWSKTYHPT
ncbi:MAG: hypothetical protein Q7J42_01875 [Sulfuritalea sp.]|nr:hypothetical protein [Sideroxyarcus sp.]MDO8786808.1 hypothetical protein [Sulfuritalea sp.]